MTSEPRRTLSLVLAAAASLIAVGAANAEPFALLIHETPAQLALRTDPGRADAYWAAYGAYGEAMARAGVLRGGQVLKASAQAETVRQAAGRVTVKAGGSAWPDAEFSGFFLIDVPDARTAADWAAKAPALPEAWVEVRPAFPAPNMK
jgi:hypothetical protein